MPYHYLPTEAQFNQKYQALVDYLQQHEYTAFSEILNILANLPDKHLLKDLFVVNGEGKSFLHLAAAQGNLELITFLKETGHNINHQDFNKKTPLYDACAKLKIGSVNALLGYDADPNLGNSHLLFKSMREIEGINEQVIYNGENIPLVAAINSEAAVTIREFAVASMTPENLSGLTDKLATERARAMIVKKLLAKGADILLQTGIDNASAFHRAIELKKLIVVNEIADVGGPEIFAQRNRDGEAALNLAVSYWEKDEKENPKSQAEIAVEEQITDMIIEHAEAKLSNLLAIQELKFGNTAIHGAVICSNYKVLKKILINGYRFDSLKNLSRQNHQGNTPIHEAIKEAWRGPKILALLLSIAMSDDLAIVNNAGETARAMAQRLLREAHSVKALVEKVEKATKDLEDLVDGSTEMIEFDEMDVPAEHGLLLKAMRDLRDSDPLDNKFSELEERGKALSLEIDNFIIELEKYDVDGLIEQAREQVEKYEQTARWSAEDAKQLIAKATTLDLPEDLKILEVPNTHQAHLSQNDANNLAASARRLVERYDRGERLLAFSIDQADEFGPKVRVLLGLIKPLEFFQKSYHDSLTEVNQESYFAWKVRQLQLPPHLPKLEAAHINLFYPPINADSTFNAASQNYEEGLNKFTSGDNLEESIHLLRVSVQLFKRGYSQHFSLAQAHRALAIAYITYNRQLDVQTHIRIIDDNNEKIRQNLQAAAEIFVNLQDYRRLELVTQDLAKIHMSNELNIANYEAQNRNKIALSSNIQEQLQGHLALAGLYKALRERKFRSHAFSIADLQIRESYHYHQAYKLTQGKLDNSAHVVLQREMGIAHNANLGTYNIQQCVAVVAFDPLSKKDVLLHFDRYSGPTSFMEQLDKEFPGKGSVHLYITGGRDRATLSNPNDMSLGLVSDNNIEFVLKQIHLKNVETAADGNPDNGRYKIKACDVGQEQFPQGVVFDVKLQRWVHATPNFLEDESVEIRSVNFMLQRANEDYIRPLNRVDFRKSEAERKVYLDPHEVHALKAQYTHYYANANFNNPQSEMWKSDQIFYPLEVVTNKMAGVPSPDFTTSLLASNFQPAESMDTSDLEDLKEALNAMQVNPNNFLGAEQMFQCLGNRRRRSAGLCTLDSEFLLEGLSELSESKQAEVLEHIATRRVAGAKQKEIATLIRQHKWSQHIQKVGHISSKAIDGFFAMDAAISFLNGDKSKAAIWIDLKGLSYLSKRGSRVAGVVLNSYNTYEDFNNLLQHSNDTAAWLRFANSGMQTTMDLGSLGLRAVEGVSETFAALEVSAAFEAVGGAVVTVLIMIDRFYEAGTAVEEEENLLRMDFSFGTKIREFWRAVVGMSSNYHEKIEDIGEYQLLIPQLQEFFKSHSKLKWYVSPAIKLIKTNKKCLSHGLTGKGCRQYQYIPIFAEIKNNSVNFSMKKTGFKLNDELQDAFPDRQFTCLPTGNDISVSTAGAYRCEGAFALTNLNSTGTTAFFNLGKGDDQAVGFQNASNIFVVNNGAKAYQGGDHADLFMLAGTHIVTASDQIAVRGGLHGGAGLDTLQLAGFKPEAESIEINLLANVMKYNDSELHLSGVERILGGALPLSVIVACGTRSLDTAEQGIIKSLDFIFIPPNLSCDYNLEMHLHTQMSVTNSADRGHFVYTVSSGKQGHVFINLAPHSRDPLALKARSIHQIEFNATLADVKAIRFPTLLDEGFPRILQLQFGHSSETAENFNFALHTPHFQTTFMRFSDQGKLKVGNKNIYYVHFDLQQSASEIIDYYAPLMRQHHLVGFFITGENEHILIGHHKHEVMYNNPSAFRTHLYGNGGQGVFVIKSGMTDLSLSRLPIPQVDIYHLPGDTHTDTLDFGPLVRQVQTQMNHTAQLFLVTSDTDNHLGDDLLLILAIPSSKNYQRIWPIVTVGIPKAFHSSQHHWFKNHLHIILEKDKPLQIVGRHKQLFLRPVTPTPWVLEKKHEIVTVNINNIETNTTIIIPEKYRAGGFFQHNKINLIWTNTLTQVKSPTEPFTLIIDKFFQRPKDLFLRFTDKTTLALTASWAKLNVTADFAKLQQTQLADLRAAFLAIIKPKHTLSSTTQSIHASATGIMQNQDLMSDLNANSRENYIDDYSDEKTHTLNFIVRERYRRAIAQDFDAATPVASGAATIQNWMYAPRIIANNILKITKEFFIMLLTPIDKATHISDTQASDFAAALPQTSLFGNKTATAHRNPMQENPINQDQPLRSCVLLSIVDTDQGYSEGISCKIPTGRINFFHNIPYKAAPQSFERPEASFTDCKPLEWYGRPSVTCEAEKVTAVITPDLSPRFFDYVNGWLMLGQVAMAMVKKLFPQEAMTDTRDQLVDELSSEHIALWRMRLSEMKIQLQSMNDRSDKKSLNWIHYRLEDRQEELEQFIKRNKLSLNQKVEFTESLSALQEMLDELGEDSQHVPPEPQQDNLMFARAANSGNYYSCNTSRFFNHASPIASCVPLNDELTHDLQHLLC